MPDENTENDAATEKPPLLPLMDMPAIQEACAQCNTRLRFLEDNPNAKRQVAEIVALVGGQVIELPIDAFRTDKPRESAIAALVAKIRKAVK